MYFWKCWRCARRSIVAYVATVTGCAVLWLLSRLGHGNGTGYEGDLVTTWGYVSAWGIAIAFGATGPGADLADGAGEFLLTRPRSRPSLAWSGWAAGFTQVVALLAFTIGVLTICGVIVSGTMWYHEPMHYHMSPGMLIMSIVLTAIVTYGLTYVLTMVFRSGKRAIVGAVVVTVVWASAADRLHDWVGITLPSLTVRAGPAHPWLLAMAWVLFALACPLVAQFALDRAEV